MNRQPLYNRVEFFHATDLTDAKLLKAIKVGFRKEFGRRVIATSVEVEDDKKTKKGRKIVLLFTDTWSHNQQDHTERAKVLKALQIGVGDTAKITVWSEPEPGDPGDLM